MDERVAGVDSGQHGGGDRDDLLLRAPLPFEPPELGLQGLQGTSFFRSPPARPWTSAVFSHGSHDGAGSSDACPHSRPGVGTQPGASGMQNFHPSPPDRKGAGVESAGTNLLGALTGQAGLAIRGARGARGTPDQLRHELSAPVRNRANRPLCQRPALHRIPGFIHARVRPCRVENSDEEEKAEMERERVTLWTVPSSVQRQSTSLPALLPEPTRTEGGAPGGTGWATRGGGAGDASGRGPLMGDHGRDARRRHRPGGRGCGSGLRAAQVRRSRPLGAPENPPGRCPQGPQGPQGEQVQPATLRFAEYVYRLHDLSRAALSAADVLEWYRLRWQVGLVFKRFKSLAPVGTPAEVRRRRQRQAQPGRGHH